MGLTENSGLTKGIKKSLQTFFLKDISVIYPKNRFFFQTNLEELYFNPLHGGSNDHPHVLFFFLVGSIHMYL